MFLDAEIGQIQETLIKDIKSFHKQKLLCGEPGNAILDMPDDILGYLIAVLKNRIPEKPKFSEEEWQRFLNILKPHGIIPLIYRLVSELPQECHPPDEIKRKMRALFLENSGRFFKVERQLGKILKEFEKCGIKILLLKGFAFSSLIYPEPAMRLYADIDILVNPSDIRAARKIFKNLGYKSYGSDFALNNYNCEEIFIPKKNRDYRAVEAHWSLHHFFALNQKFAMEELFKSAVKVNPVRELSFLTVCADDGFIPPSASIGDDRRSKSAAFSNGVKSLSISFETLNVIDAILNQAIHIALTHRKDIKLIWIYDLNLLVKKLDGLDDWRKLLEKSVEWGARLALEASLKMAIYWTDLKLPPEIDNFSLWPKPSCDEISVWKNAEQKNPSIKNEIEMRVPKNLSFFKKVILFFYFLFPPFSIIRRTYPPSQSWLIPLSYIKRWISLMKSML